MRTSRFAELIAAALALWVVFAVPAAADGPNIYDATLMEPDAKTGEVSTNELRRAIADGRAIIIDARPRAEFVGGHIPGARLIDGPASEHVAAVERIANGNKAAALIVYCNGPYCQASRRLADQLVAAGFTNVRRYQLGMPIWRALGGPTIIELDGIVRIARADATAVFIDARPAEEFAKGSLPHARNLTRDTLDGTLKNMMSGKLQDSPLPLDDFNRRIVLFGADASQAADLAEAMSKRPWHNVSYFAGSYKELEAALPK